MLRISNITRYIFSISFLVIWCGQSFGVVQCYSKSIPNNLSSCVEGKKCNNVALTIEVITMDLLPKIEKNVVTSKSFTIQTFNFSKTIGANFTLCGWVGSFNNKGGSNAGVRYVAPNTSLTCQGVVFDVPGLKPFEDFFVVDCDGRSNNAPAKNGP